MNKVTPKKKKIIRKEKKKISRLAFLLDFLIATGI